MAKKLFLFDLILLCFSAGTRFRPLSFNTPKPLFPLAGQPMVHHPISACKRVRFSTWLKWFWCFLSVESYFCFSLDRYLWIVGCCVDTQFSSNFSYWILWGEGIRSLRFFFVQWVETACEVTADNPMYLILVMACNYVVLKCWWGSFHCFGF